MTPRFANHSAAPPVQRDRVTWPRAVADLVAVDEALLLALVEDVRAPGPTGAWEVIDTEQLNYTLSGFDGQIPPSLVIKKARPAGEPQRHALLLPHETGRPRPPWWPDPGRSASAPPWRARRPKARSG